MAKGATGTGAGSGEITFTAKISRESAEALWTALGAALRGTSGGGKKGSAADAKGPILKSGGTPRRRNP